MLEKTNTSSYSIIKKAVPTFYFIGVTTGKSSIMKVFPLWMKELGHSDMVIEGIDHKIHDDAEAYRKSVAQIKYDPLSYGALVTTHKIDLLNASRDMFDYLDEYAQICGEISSISKRDEALEGHAKDPITSGLSLDAVLGEGYFSITGGEVLCFGAGGSGVAIALHLIKKANPSDRPKRFIVVNRSQGRLDHMRSMVEGQNTDIQFEYICNSDPKINDKLMSNLHEGSLVINGTGMGKDSPGSPITNEGVFPKNGIAWELNYRGELDFMHQAFVQKDNRHLWVEDGWLYFLHGWTQVIGQVLHIDITPELFKRLAEVASILKPS